MSIETLGSLGAFDDRQMFDSTLQGIEKIQKDVTQVTDREEKDKLSVQEREMRAYVAIDFLSFLNEKDVSWKKVNDRPVGGVMSGGMHLKEYKTKYGDIEYTLSCVFESAPHLEEGIEAIRFLAGDQDTEKSNILSVKYPNVTITATMKKDRLLSAGYKQDIFTYAGFTYHRETSRATGVTEESVSAPSVAYSHVPCYLEQEYIDMAKKEISHLIGRLDLVGHEIK